MKRRLTVLSAFIIAGCAPATTTSSPGSIPVATPPAGPAAAPPVAIPVNATATIVDASGARIGSANFSDTPAGLLVIGSVSGLGIGAHGIHLHAVGKCEAPFTTAGGHFNPGGVKHGFRNPAGHHAGDMPNLVSPASGAAGFQFLVAGVKLTGPEGLLDADGAAIVIHSGADDYMTDPAGASGARLACGVITLTR